MTLLNGLIILVLVLGVLLAVVLVTRQRGNARPTAATPRLDPAPPPAAEPAAHQPRPKDAEALATISRRCLEDGDLARAQKGFRSLLLLPLDAGPITKAEVYFHLGEIHDRLGERAKAFNMLERALEADPTFAPARELLGRLSASG